MIMQSSIREYLQQYRSRITITGPRSVGKTTIAKILSKKLKVPYFSSDEAMDIATASFGGLDGAIKSGDTGFIMRFAIPHVQAVMREPMFVYDLAGGAVTSGKFALVSKRIARIIEKNSLVIGLIPAKNIKESVEFLFSREKRRYHFKGYNHKALRIKVRNDLKKFLQLDFLNICDYIVCVKNKSKMEIINEILMNIQPKI